METVEGLTVASMVPLPVSATAWEPAPVFSVSVKVAVRLPTPTGEKLIGTRQLCDSAMPAGHGDAVAANSAGLLDEIASTNNVAWPMFLMVRFLITVSPTGTVPSTRLAADAAFVSG